jgi:H+/Cl- antiporter ClcA
MKTAAIAAVFFAAWPTALLACATCFGDPDSPMTKGMNVGVLVLLFVCGVVLGAIGAFFLYLFKRSKMFIINGPEDLGLRRMKEVRAFHD